MDRNKAVGLVVLAVVIGTGIAYVDSRPTWDDTGMTVGAVFLSAAILAALHPRTWWLVGLGVSVPVLVFDLILHGSVGAAAAVVVGLVGAAAGFLIGNALGTPKGVQPP